MFRRWKRQKWATWILILLVLPLPILTPIAGALMVSISGISRWAFRRHWAVCNSLRRWISVAIIIGISTTATVFGILSARQTRNAQLNVYEFHKQSGVKEFRDINFLWRKEAENVSGSRESELNWWSVVRKSLSQLRPTKIYLERC